MTPSRGVATSSATDKVIAPVPHKIAVERPEHMIRRNLVNRGFTPRRVTDEGSVRETSAQTLARQCELVLDVAARCR